MAKNQLEKRWTVYGRHLERDAQGMARPTLRTNCSLDIKEESHNIRMGDGTKGPYGIPISTGAAVSLIKNMLDVLESNGIDFFGSSANVENKQLKNDLLTQLILNSMGVTFDKSQLLRIISQPKCEGVRFYQAVRKGQGRKPDTATLVLVGVDKNGNDLNYDKINKKTLKVKQDDTCESLVDDWGHPPGSGNAYLKYLKSKKTNERYVLLRLAQQL